MEVEGKRREGDSIESITFTALNVLTALTAPDLAGFSSSGSSGGPIDEGSVLIAIDRDGECRGTQAGTRAGTRAASLQLPDSSFDVREQV